MTINRSEACLRQMAKAAARWEATASQIEATNPDHADCLRYQAARMRERYGITPPATPVAPAQIEHTAAPAPRPAAAPPPPPPPSPEQEAARLVAEITASAALVDRPRPRPAGAPAPSGIPSGVAALLAGTTPPPDCLPRPVQDEPAGQTVEELVASIMAAGRLVDASGATRGEEQTVEEMVASIVAAGRADGVYGRAG